MSECDAEQLADVSRAEPYARRLSDIMPLEALAYEERGGRSELKISGRGEAEDMIHVVHQPEKIEFEKSIQGGHRGLNVHTASGRIVLLRFRTAAVPEVLNGVTENELPPE